MLLSDIFRSMESQSSPSPLPAIGQKMVGILDSRYVQYVCRVTTCDSSAKPKTGKGQEIVQYNMCVTFHNRRSWVLFRELCMYGSTFKMYVRMYIYIHVHTYLFTLLNLLPVLSLIPCVVVYVHQASLLSWVTHSDHSCKQTQESYFFVYHYLCIVYSIHICLLCTDGWIKILIWHVHLGMLFLWSPLWALRRTIKRGEDGPLSILNQPYCC
jgi:hypothetical protein